MTDTNMKTATLVSTSTLDAATQRIVADIGAATRHADNVTVTYNDGCLALLHWLTAHRYTPDHLSGGKGGLYAEIKEAFATGYFLKADLAIWKKGPHAKGSPGDKLNNKLNERVKRVVTRMQEFVSASKADPKGEVAYRADGKPIAKSDASKGGARGQNKPLKDSLLANLQAQIKRIAADRGLEKPKIKGHDDLIAAYKITIKWIVDLNK